MARKGFPRAKKKDPRKGVKRKHNNIPDDLDLQLWAEKVEKLSKGLDEDFRPAPLTENALKQLIRSAVREKWMFQNSKLHFLESNKQPDMRPNTRTRGVWECNYCHELFKSDEVNVDHISQEESFTSLEDALPWASSILNAGGSKDLQILCIPCHDIKSHVDKTGLSWEDAVIDKKAIAWGKDKTKKHQDILMAWGFTKLETSNATKRRACYAQHLKNVAAKKESD